MKFLDFELSKKFEELGFKKRAYGFYTTTGTFSFAYSNFRGVCVVDCTCNYNSFPEDVIGHEFVDAPTIEQALNWMLETKSIHINAVAESPDTWYAEIHFLKDGKTITLLEIVESRDDAYISAFKKLAELL